MTSQGLEDVKIDRPRVTVVVVSTTVVGDIGVIDVFDAVVVVAVLAADTTVGVVHRWRC